jgi:antitoxin VapB
MSLNIRSAETHRLAKQLAALTGESITTAVTEAIRERLERITLGNDREAIAERLLKIGAECAAHLKKPFHRTDPDELLYDNQGLPK